MTTNFRALCAELVAAFNSYHLFTDAETTTAWQRAERVNQAITAAVAALKAEPEGEGPSVEQMYYWALKSIYKYGSDTLSELADDREWLRAAVAEMVRRAQESLDYGTPVAQPAPEVSNKQIEAAAKLIYASMRSAATDNHGACDWVERGNSLMQGEARRTARAVLNSQDRPATPTTPPAPEPGDVQKHVTHDHELKVWGSFFEALLDGTKNFEVRHNDRDFKPGDYLLLREWVENEYTGRELIKCVTYVLKGGIFGVEAGYVVLALAAKQTNAMQRLLSAPMDARGYLDLCTPTPPAPAPESVALNGYLQGYEAGRRDAAADAQQAAEAAQDPPAPESEEMQGLVIDLTEVSLVLDEMKKPRLAAALTRAAMLLKRQDIELATLRAVPVTISPGLAEKVYLDTEGRCWHFMPGFPGVAPEWRLIRPDELGPYDTHVAAASAIPLPAPQFGEVQL